MLRQLTFILIFLPLSVVAQYQICNKSLVDSSLSILYVGIENVIEIKGPDDLLDYELIVSTGTLTKMNNEENLYSFVINNNKNLLDTLSIRSKNKELFSKVFKVEKVGYPVAKVGKIQDTLASTSELVSNPFLIVDIPNCSWKHDYQIRYYSLYFIANNDSVPFNLIYPKGIVDTMYIFNNVTLIDSLVTFERTEDKHEPIIQSNKFPYQLVNRIKELNTGDQIIFHSIMAGCPSCPNFILAPIRFWISN